MTCWTCTAASEWAADKVRGASHDLDEPTTCEGWNVRTLMSHMLETQRYFAGSARGEDVSPPHPMPLELTHDPINDFARSRADVMRAFAAAG